MNVFEKFDEIPSMILQDIKETKCYGHTHGRTDNVKTVYPHTNTVCRGYKYRSHNKNYLCMKQELVNVTSVTSHQYKQYRLCGSIWPRCTMPGIFVDIYFLKATILSY